MHSLDHFWEQADDEGSAQNPLERELAERLDALARYRELILEMEAASRTSDAEILLRQHDREYQAVQRLWAAIRRMNRHVPPRSSSRPGAVDLRADGQ